MNTITAKKIAQNRHDFMMTYLEQFFFWNGIMLNNNMDLSTGKIVWICAYDKLILNTIPYLKIEPIKCITILNELLPVCKRLYSHDFHYLPINNENILSENILLDHNLNLLIYNDNRIYVFDNEEDCTNKWNELINYCIEELDLYFKNMLNDLKLLKIK